MKKETALTEALPRSMRSFAAAIVGTVLVGTSLSAGAATITSSSGFVNTSISSQTGTFTATFDATPSISPANDLLSFSNGAQTAYTGMAAAVRFNTTGTIDARNGGIFAAASNVPFLAGKSYHFRMVVNVAAHTYSAYVTPPGGAELTIASNYAFRTEQAGISSINNFDADVNATPGGSLTYTIPTIGGSSSSVSSSSSSSISSKSSSSSSVSSSSKSSVSSVSSSSGSTAGTTINSSNGFVNSVIVNQTGSFTANFDAKPSGSPANDVLSFSNGAQMAYTGMAASVRFNTTGTIDARNGSAYAAVTNVPFLANTTYHFRLVINVAARTYSAYVTPPGGSELTIAGNYAFRTEQASVTNINNFDANVNAAPGGSLTYTLPTITGNASSSFVSSSSVSVSSSSSSKSSSSSSASSSSSSKSSASSSSISSSSSSASSAKTPANVLSFAHWTLQTFDSSASTIVQIDSATLMAGYTDKFFYYAHDVDGDAVAFFAPDNGAHTTNSLHPRSELRELKADGQTNALWNPFDSMTHAMSASLKVTNAPHRLCIGQIHADAQLTGTGPASIKPLLELYYEPNGDLTVAFQDGPADIQTEHPVNLNVPVGQKFSYVIQVQGGIESVAVTYGGTTKTVSQAIPSSFKNYGQYFKAGDYNQTNDNTQSTGTQDRFYSLRLVHQ
jgi:hypothetical protein